MDDFKMFLKIGFEHISDLSGYDHILFIVALCAVYSLRDWKEIIWLVTAFTIGHSVTLVLATIDWVYVSPSLVDKIIPFTILLTCMSNIFFRKRHAKDNRRAYIKYGITFGFGLIHGLGFSGYLRNMLAMDESIVWQLLAFNIGLELGQLLIVAVTLLIAVLVIDVFRANKREWNLFLSGAAAGVSLILILGL